MGRSSSIPEDVKSVDSQGCNSQKMFFGSEQSSSQVVVGMPTAKQDVITDETLEEIEHKYPFKT